MLPGMSGWRVLNQVNRNEGNRTPDNTGYKPVALPAELRSMIKRSQVWSAALQPFTQGRWLPTNFSVKLLHLTEIIHS